MREKTAKELSDAGLVRVSVVIPLYNEQVNLAELHRRLTATLKARGCPYELVFVNDGSRDNTPHLLTELAQADHQVTVVHLSRNFGHQAALCAGLEHARGQAVIVMDGDLQDPPEVLGQFLDKWLEGFEVVFAVRTKRKEGILKRTAYYLFYRLLRAVSDVDIPLDSGDFCLMDRAVVAAILALPERQRFVRGLRTFVGFRQTGLVYERAARAAGKPKYTFRALVRLAMDGLVNFSTTPLNLITYAGLLIALITAALTCWFLGASWAHHSCPPGWAVTVLVVLFLGSIQLLSLGVIAQYLRTIFIEVKGRPTYLARDVFRRALPPRKKTGLPIAKRLDFAQGRSVFISNPEK